MLNEEMMNKEQKLDSFTRRLEDVKDFSNYFEKKFENFSEEFSEQNISINTNQKTLDALVEQQKKHMDEMIHGNDIVSKQSDFVLRKHSLIAQIKKEIYKNQDELEEMQRRLENNSRDFAHLDEYTQQTLNNGLLQSINEKKRTIESLLKTKNDHESLLGEVQNTIKSHLEKLKKSKRNTDEMGNLIDNLKNSHQYATNASNRRWLDLQTSLSSFHYELDDLNKLESDLEELVDTQKSKKFTGLIGKLKLIAKISIKIANGTILEEDGGYIDTTYKKTKEQELLEKVREKKTEIEGKFYEMTNKLDEAERKREEQLKELEKNEKIEQIEEEIVLEQNKLSNNTVQLIAKVEELGLDKSISSQYANTIEKYEDINPHIHKEVIDEVHVFDKNEDAQGFDIQERVINQNLNNLGLLVSKASKVDKMHSTNLVDMMNESRSVEGMQKIGNIAQPLSDNLQTLVDFSNTDIPQSVMDEYNKFNAEVAADMNNELYWLGNTQKIDKFTDITQKAMNQADKQIKAKKPIGNLTKNYQAMRNPQAQQQQANQTPSSPQGQGKTKKAVKNQKTQTTKTQGLG